MHLLAIRVSLDPALSTALQEWLKAINNRKKANIDAQNDPHT